MDLEEKKIIKLVGFLNCCSFIIEVVCVTTGGYLGHFLPEISTRLLNYNVKMYNVGQMNPLWSFAESSAEH